MKRYAIICVTCLVLVAGKANGQTSTGTIGGVVRDTTGAVLPGVTVEAGSPALIEKARTVVTDDQGRYQIVELRPGTYAVTFELSGFSSLKREGIDLSAGFTATVNVELRVGAVEETITVSGASPVVDLQNVRQSTVVPREQLDALPIGKQYADVAALVPGMGRSAQDVGGQLGMSWNFVSIHGGRQNDTKTQVDGMTVQSAANQSTTGIYFSDANYQEFVIDTGAMSAEAETGGVRINMVPREGSNTFQGVFQGSFGNNALSSTNVDGALKQAGLKDPNSVKSVWNTSGNIGGPLKQNKIWFFGTYSRFVTASYVSGLYANLTPTGRAYTPDLTERAIDNQSGTSAATRVTWQVTARNKLTAYFDYNTSCHCHYSVGPAAPGVSPEASLHHTYFGKIGQITWSAPMNNRLLFEAGLMIEPEPADYARQPGTTGIRITDSGTGYTWGGYTPSHISSRNKVTRGSLSYVTGTHSVKAGLVLATLDLPRQIDALPYNSLTYTLLNGNPINVTYLARGYSEDANTLKYGIFGQDQVAWKRLTANFGLRFDYYRAGYPDQTAPVMSFIPYSRLFPGQTLVTWKDLSPRLGVAYDLFGRGKTALKMSASRYVGAGLPGNPGPIGILGNDTRRWTDTNGDLVPDGDPTNPLANGELGPRTNGLFSSTATPIIYDPATHGWGKRPDSNWETSVGIQQELLPGVSVSATYFRRTYQTFLVTDNVAVGPNDYTPYCVTIPLDPRLPGRGGGPLCGLYDLNPPKVGQTSNVRNMSSQFGNQSDVFNGADATLSGRVFHRLVMGGGVSLGKWSANDCSVITSRPDITASQYLQTFAVSTQGSNVGAFTFSSGPSVSTSFCDLATPVLVQGKLSGTLGLPWNLHVSGVFQSLPGSMILANAAFTSAQIAPSLGRQLSAASAVTINIVRPGSMWGPRLNQVDVRLAKTFEIQPVRLQAIVDVFNALNVNTVVGFNNTYGSNGATWLAPGQILAPRLVKLGVQLNF